MTSLQVDERMAAAARALADFLEAERTLARARTRACRRHLRLVN